MIVYNIITGRILRELPPDQNFMTFFGNYPQEFKDSLASIEPEFVPINLQNYKVINEELVRRTDQEIQELLLYGRVLTEEERLLNQLKPPYEEVAKAKNTIEMINLIQEVM